MGWLRNMDPGIMGLFVSICDLVDLNIIAIVLWIKEVVKQMYPELLAPLQNIRRYLLQWLVALLTLKTVCALALVVVGARIARRVIRSLRGTFLDRYDADKRVLWSQFPDDVWRQVFRHGETLEQCSEASGVLGVLGLRTGFLSLFQGNALPPVSREWNVGEDPESPTALLWSLVSLKIPITTFRLHINRDFRPDGEALYSFLALQTDTLQTLHVSCLESCYVRSSLPLKLPTMRQVRVLEIMRSVTCVRKSIVFLQSLDKLFPELESVRLSLWGWEDWSDLFAGFPVCDTVRHVSFVCHAFSIKFWPLCRAATVFPNVESLEIPCIRYLVRHFHDWIRDAGLRRLTLTTGPGGQNAHAINNFLTSYRPYACTKILKSPDRDPDEVYREIEEACERNWVFNFRWGLPQWFGIHRGHAERRATEIQNTFRDLEELRFKCENKYGPTAVCVPDLLRMPSLRTLDFGGSSRHIPEHMMRQLRDRFSVKF